MMRWRIRVWKSGCARRTTGSRAEPMAVAIRPVLRPLLFHRGAHGRNGSRDSEPTHVRTRCRWGAGRALSGQGSRWLRSAQALGIKRSRGMLLFNFGPGDESISYQVVLTPSATAAKAPPLLSFGLPQKYEALKRREPRVR